MVANFIQGSEKYGCFFGASQTLKFTEEIYL